MTIYKVKIPSSFSNRLGNRYSRGEDDNLQPCPVVGAYGGDGVSRSCSREVVCNVCVGALLLSLCLLVTLIILWDRQQLEDTRKELIANLTTDIRLIQDRLEQHERELYQTLVELRALHAQLELGGYSETRERDLNDTLLEYRHTQREYGNDYMKHKREKPVSYT